MEDTIIVISGREFTSEDIELIKWTRKKYPQLSRSELAATVCEFIGWVTPAGRPKKPQGMQLLEKLELDGHIELPPARNITRKPNKAIILDYEIDTTPIEGVLSDFAPVYLEIARVGEDLKLWRKYINDYHIYTFNFSCII